MLGVVGWTAARQHGQALFAQRLRYVHGYARPGESMARFWALMLYATAIETGQDLASITPEQLRYRLTDVVDHYHENDMVRTWMCAQLQRAGHHVTNPAPHPTATTGEAAVTRLTARLDHVEKLATGQRDDPVVNEWTSYMLSPGHFGAAVSSMVRMLDAGLLAERGGWLHGTMVRAHCHRPLAWCSTIPAYGGRAFTSSPHWMFDHDHRTLTAEPPDAYLIMDAAGSPGLVQVDRHDLTPAPVPEPPELAHGQPEPVPESGWCAALERADGLVRASMGDQHADTWTYWGAVLTLALALHGLARRTSRVVEDVPLAAVLNILFSPAGLDDLVNAVIGRHTPAWVWLLRWWPRDVDDRDDGLRRVYAAHAPEPALHLCRNHAIRAIELPLLAERGGPMPGSLVHVTGGEHRGRTGRIHAWTWGITPDGTLAAGPPRSYAVEPPGEVGRFFHATLRDITSGQGHRQR